MKAKGHVWHKSSMKKGIVPRPGIDTDARWGYSHTKGWVFGYKLHIISTTGELVVPLTADVTTANVPDNKMYIPLTSSSSSIFSLPYVLNIISLSEAPGSQCAPPSQINPNFGSVRQRFIGDTLITTRWKRSLLSA